MNILEYHVDWMPPIREFTAQSQQLGMWFINLNYLYLFYFLISNPVCTLYVLHVCSYVIAM